jgi:N-acetylneuraminic acid mutarotase
MADVPGEAGVLLWDGFDHGGGSELLDLWAYQPGAGWTKRSEGLTAPGADVFVYVPTAGRVVILSVSGETWSYDLMSGNWENRKAVGAPSVVGARAAYDSKADRLIVFGGLPGDYSAGNFRPASAPIDQTWAYDYKSNRWTQMHPKVSPPARNFHALAYDEASDRVILFGGTGDLEAVLKDTWAYDYNRDTWTQMSPPASPSGRSFSQMVYDVARDRMVIFGGTDDGRGSGYARMRDTWTYDYDRDRWTELKILGPSARAYHMLAYDRESKQIVLFGGGGGPNAYDNQVWLFDSSKDTWTRG